MKLITKLLITSVSVLLSCYLLDGVRVDTHVYAVLVALVIGLLNVTVKPIMVVFTLPATILTFGLFLLVINALIVLLADRLLGGFSVDGFWWALAFSVIVTVTNSIFYRLLDERE